MAEILVVRPGGNDPAQVEIHDGVLVVRELEEHDPEVVRTVEEADDPVEATRQCLRIGARAVRAANVSVDSDLIERRFDVMTDRFDERVEEAVEQIAGVTTNLLDQDTGVLPAALQAHRSELETLLGATFDPDSTKSVIAVLQRVLGDAHKAQTDAIRRLVTVDGDDSPLSMLQRHIARDFKDQLSDVRKDVHELSEKIAVNAAVAPVYELTTGKGFTFEDLVDASVNRIAAQHGDLAERVGRASGTAGTQKGDEVVTLSRDDTHGIEGRFVLEAKSGKLNMRKTMEELDAALENRDASAAVAVFASQACAPTSVAFHYCDNKAIVVLDKEELDDSALRLAYMWARWMVRRELSVSETDELNLARIAALIEDARRAIERGSTIKACHSKARRSIEQAGEQVAAMVGEVETALDQLAAELAKE
jgi:hypothetical protein